MNDPVYSGVVGKTITALAFPDQIMSVAGFRSIR